MSAFSQLPRDLQLRIVQSFDMETRIKAGIINKIRPPPQLIIAIAKSHSLRRPVPKWLPEKYVWQRTAVVLPINENRAYEIMYDGSLWFTPRVPMQYFTALLHAPLDDVSKQRCSPFPDVRGLPEDFVEMASRNGWIINTCRSSLIHDVCIQPGSAFLL